MVDLYSKAIELEARIQRLEKITQSLMDGFVIDSYLTKNDEKSNKEDSESETSET